MRTLIGQKAIFDESIKHARAVKPYFSLILRGAGLAQW